MYAGREILLREKILADLEKLKTRRFFPTRIFPLGKPLIQTQKIPKPPTLYKKSAL